MGSAASAVPGMAGGGGSDLGGALLSGAGGGGKGGGLPGGGAGKSGPGGSSAANPGQKLQGRGEVDPQTGQYRSWDERIWSGATGKYPPSEPRLPRGFDWLPGLLSGVAGTGAMNLNYGDLGSTRGGSAAERLIGSTSPESIGQAGQRGIDILGNVGSAGNVASIQDQLTQAMLPGLSRAFERGSAQLREQNALTGNLSGSGVQRELSDFYGGLESDTANRIAGLVPSILGSQAQAGSTLAGLPVNYGTGLYLPGAQSSLNFRQLPFQGLGLATSAIGGAPFFANQGSSGNGAAGGLLGGMFGK